MNLITALTSAPQTKRDIAYLAGLGTRDVEAQINELRRQGVPICSDSRGYWLAQTSEEVADCAKRLRVRAINQLLTARSLRAASRRMADVDALTLWDAA